MKKISLARSLVIIAVIAIPFAVFGNRGGTGLALAIFIAINAAVLAAVMTLRHAWFLIQALAFTCAGGICGWLLDQAPTAAPRDSFIGPGIFFGLLTGLWLILIQTMATRNQPFVTVSAPPGCSDGESDDPDSP